MKKIIALLLATLMVVGMFAGCGPTSNPNKPGGSGNNYAGGELEFPYEVDENGDPVYGDLFANDTIEWWVSSNYALNNDTWIFKKIEEVVGCKINVTRYDSETYATKLNAALNTNSLPDICALTTGYATYNLWGDQGAFVNLLDSENLAKMPNVKAVMDIPEVKEQMEFFKSDMGAIYGFIRYNTERTVNYGWCYRKDIFDKHGIEMWEDSASFLDVLRQLKKLYPDSYPMTGATMESPFGRIINAYGANSLNAAYNWDTNEWFLGAASEGCYEMLKVFQTAWNEGLVDPDIFQNKTGDITSNIVNGTSFVYNSWIGYMADQNYAGQQVDPNFKVSYAPQIGPEPGKCLADQLPLVNNTSVIINAQSDCVDACLAAINFLYADEGYAITVGEEGVTFKMVDGKRVYLKADGTEQVNPTIQTLEEQFGLWQAGMYFLAPRDSVYFTYSDVEELAQTLGCRDGFHKRVPAYTIDQDYADEWYDAADAVNYDIIEFCAEFVTQNLSKEDWEARCEMWDTKYGIYIDYLNGNY